MNFWRLRKEDMWAWWGIPHPPWPEVPFVAHIPTWPAQLVLHQLECEAETKLTPCTSLTRALNKLVDQLHKLELANAVAAAFGLANCSLITCIQLCCLT